MSQRPLSDPQISAIASTERIDPALVKTISEAAVAHDLPPVFLLAIAKRETDFGRGSGYDSNTGLGDNGNGYGIFQLDKNTKSHVPLLASVQHDSAKAADVAATMLQQSVAAGLSLEQAAHVYNSGDLERRTTTGIYDGRVGVPYQTAVMGWAKGYGDVAEVVRSLPVDRPSHASEDPKAFGRAASAIFLKNGSQGADVAAVQRELGVVADGQIGPRTERAVREFQSTHHLHEDGIVGPETRAELAKSLDSKTDRHTSDQSDGAATLQHLAERATDEIREAIETVENVTANVARRLGIESETHRPGTSPARDLRSVEGSTQASVASRPGIDRIIAAVPRSEQAFARESVPLLLDAAQRAGITDNRQVAYILATAEREAQFGKTMVEGGNGKGADGVDHYFDRYEPGTRQGEALGNTEVGDGERFRGRGYVQVTGRAHAVTFSERLGMPDAVVDGKPTPYFVAHPEALARPDIAAETMVTGMRDGTFSGRSLDHYIDGRKADYVGARHIVNGTDHAQEIARDAERFERAIEGTTLHRGHEPHEIKRAVERAIEKGAAHLVPVRDVVPWGGEVREGRLVRVDERTMAMHVGRGSYVSLDVERDLAGRAPETGTVMTLNRSGAHEIRGQNLDLGPGR